jgi:hypothetical protein
MKPKVILQLLFQQHQRRLILERYLKPEQLSSDGTRDLEFSKN